MAYATRHPEKIERLIICDSAAPKFSDTAFRFNDIFPDKVAQEEVNTKQLSAGKAAEENLKIYFSMLFYSEENRDSFLRAAPAFKIDQAVNGMIQRDIRQMDMNPEIAKLKMPTLVLTGRYDINVAPTTAFKIHLQIPESQFVVFERCGHMPFFEEPDKFIQTVNGFLAGK